MHWEVLRLAMAYLTTSSLTIFCRACVCLICLQTTVLRVSIHCEGCKKKVKKVLHNIEGTLISISSYLMVRLAQYKLDAATTDIECDANHQGCTR